MEAEYNKGGAANMKRLIIVCEGPTEQEFCSSVLAPEMLRHGIYVETPVIKHSRGGIVPWKTLKGQLINHLHEGDSVVSTLIDYYGIKERHEFPGWNEAMGVENKAARLHFLFSKMQADLPEDLRGRFIPYIQLHEFEGLLFSNVDAFRESFSENEIDIEVLIEAANSFDNPELINDGPTTAPSKRLQKAIVGYSKVLYGNYLAMDIGLAVIRNKCPLFDEWVERLIACSRA